MVAQVLVNVVAVPVAPGAQEPGSKRPRVVELFHSLANSDQSQTYKNSRDYDPPDY
jgi:hypothetical protein